MKDRDWHVLLLSGASGTGKTTVAAELARSYGVGICEIDDLYSALIALTTPEQQPLLHYWDVHGATREWTPEEIADVTFATAGALAPAIRAVVDTHLDCGPPVIIEGDYVLPALAGELRGPQVEAVFLYEDDEDHLMANFGAREPEGGVQLMRARVSAILGQRIATEAAEHGVPAVAARPWNTLFERVQALL